MESLNLKFSRSKTLKPPSGLCPKFRPPVVVEFPVCAVVLFEDPTFVSVFLVELPTVELKCSWVVFAWEPPVVCELPMPEMLA